MKKTSKWPSRAFNLLVVLAMVISLSAILVAPPIAAAQDEAPCNPTPVYNGCHLDVAVSTYIKDADRQFPCLRISFHLCRQIAFLCERGGGQ